MNVDRQLRGMTILGLICLLFGGTAAHAQSATPAPPISDDAVNAVSRNLYCPVCQNTPLEVCPTEACARWREQVRELLGQGKSEDQVRQYFIDHFGMRTVGAPTDPGSRLLTVGVPFGLILLIGAAAVFGIMRRKRPTLAADPPGEVGYGDEVTLPQDAQAYRARLEAELENLE